jgi:pyridinium-3,5-biscarboxylic acid mononucleotide sulfurtransferase
MNGMDSTLSGRLEALQERVRCLGKAMIAYSGGVDSALLADVAYEVLGSRMLAVVADSPSLARAQLRDALAFAEERHIPVEVIATRELEDPAYARNDSQRCFHCKDELFTVMEAMRLDRGFESVAYGVNVDDQRDFRPGQRAASLHHVAAPLLDAGLGKDDVRQLASSRGLRVWDKPASACLSSRLEYGRPVTREALAAVEQGEDALHALGFRECRVRHHGSIARIEIGREELQRALSPDMAAHLARIFKGLGFTYVTLDLEGFRSGSMNSLIRPERLASEPS